MKPINNVKGDKLLPLFTNPTSVKKENLRNVLKRHEEKLEEKGEYTEARKWKVKYLGTTNVFEGVRQENTYKVYELVNTYTRKTYRIWKTLKKVNVTGHNYIIGEAPPKYEEKKEEKMVEKRRRNKK